MSREGRPRSHRAEAVQRQEGIQTCPYCDRRMLEVPFMEHPELEVLLCYACGGCVIYEVTKSSLQDVTG